MDIRDRHNLADAYMSAWHAVKGSHDRMVINPEPNGWYEIIQTIGSTRMERRVRCAALLSGLAALTAQLETQCE
jgi:hypothetical protein